MLFLTNKEKITNLILAENEKTRKEKNLSSCVQFLTVQKVQALVYRRIGWRAQKTLKDKTQSGSK